jgi:hypothetical protein
VRGNVDSARSKDGIISPHDPASDLAGMDNVWIELICHGERVDRNKTDLLEVLQLNQEEPIRNFIGNSFHDTWNMKNS